LKKFAIIVAGGSGTRMQSEVPKQFLLVEDEPIIVKTIKRFWEADTNTEIIVVLPEKHFTHWESLVDTYPLISSVKTVYGGATRTDSVKAGLNAISDEGLVAIHDAVRPFVPVETINASFDSANKNGSGVAVVQMKDSLREIAADNSSEARDRSKFVLVQTPQTFQVRLIKQVFAALEGQTFTDDATAFEAAGHPVYLVEGSYANIKITTPEDLV